MNDVLHGILYSLAAVLLLTWGGNRATRLLLGWARPKDNTLKQAGEAHPAGWIIGGLERLIIAIGIVTHSWEILAAVIALKTVARFKGLDDQAFAEYFLVGSLFSVLWAVLVTTAWLAYDHHFGVGIGGWFTSLADGAGPTPPPTAP